MQRPVLVALKHTTYGEVFGTGMIRESAQQDDFNKQLSFWLNRACGSSHVKVVFLDKFGNVDAAGLFYELRWDPDIFQVQVIHP